MIENEKKIIFVINHYSNNSNQHLFHTINLMRELANKGVKIAVIIERCEGEVPFIHENIEVYAQKARNKALRILELLKALDRYMRRGYKKVFVRISIHASVCGIIVAKIRKGETYFWHSGQGFEIMDEMNASRRRNIERGRRRIRWIGKHVTKFMTGPETMINYYNKWCDIPINKISLMYNDIDINRFNVPDVDEKSNLRKKLGLEEEKIYVLFVHRFSPVRKSCYYLPYCIEDAYFKNENIQFIFIGDGDDEPVIRSQLSDRDNVCFLGSRPNSEIHEYYKACDIFWNPTFCEGFPRVIIEAMACGMPIVTTNAGGISDIVGEFQGKYVTDVSDRDGMIEMLKLMIEEKEIRNSCASENRKNSERFSTECVVDMYIKTFWG